MTPNDYPLLLHFPYFDLYRKQVVKQPDLVLALLVRGDAFTPEQKARDFAYYEALTVRDSSLAACIQSIVAAEVGHLDLAYDYLGEAALLDLDDLEHNTRDGLHIASLAGTWLALVMGFGGLRNFGQPAQGAGLLTFAPRLPAALTRLAFRLVYMARRISVEITASEASYLLRTGDPLDVEHHGARLQLRPGQPVARPIPAINPGPAPTQPSGRAPAHRVPAVPATAAGVPDGPVG
jgi:alpha,alpha-trehalose phosphorylase